MDFGQVYQLYFKDLFLFILSMTKNKDIAEEIAQETFVKALKSADKFDGSKDIRAWLFSIAKNTYFTYYKREKIYDDREIENLEEESEDISQKLIDKESTMLIYKYVHKMKEPYKEVFYLRIFGELSFKQIGDLFGKSESWARVTFYRAKQQITKEVKDFEKEE